MFNHHAQVAQLAEQQSSKLRVGGSNPPLRTILLVAVLAAGMATPLAANAKKHAHKESHGEAKAASHRGHVARTSRAAHSEEGPVRLVGKQRHPGKKGRGRVAMPVKSTPGDAKKTLLTEDTQPRVAKNLQKSAAPMRIEFGCTSVDGSLVAVGQVMKTHEKAFRCQQTWDFENGKMVSYPAWIELFMPAAILGAGLKETASPGSVPTPIDGNNTKPALTPSFSRADPTSQNTTASPSSAAPVSAPIAPIPSAVQPSTPERTIKVETLDIRQEYRPDYR